MRDSKTISIGDEAQDVTVRELMVAEVDTLLGKLAPRQGINSTEILLDTAIPIEAVALATGLPEADLAGKGCRFTPSELDEIWKAVAEVNDFLSRFLEKLAVEGLAILAELNSGNGVVK